MEYEDFGGLQVPQWDDQQFKQQAHRGAQCFTSLIADRRPTEWIVQDIVPRGALVLMAGDPKVAMKSYLSMQMSLCIARGEPFLGQQTKGPAPSIYCNLEDGKNRTANRAYRFGVRTDSRLERNAIAITDPDDLPLLVQLIRRTRPLIVFIDPLINLCLLHGVDDENSSSQVTKVIRRWQRLAQETGTSIVVVHHYNKSGDIRGSTALRASCDGWLEIDPCKDDRRLLTATLRDGEGGLFQVGIEITKTEKDHLTFAPLDPEDVEVTTASELRRAGKMDNTKQRSSGDSPRRSRSELRADILAFMNENPEQTYSVRVIRAEVKGRAATISKALQEAADEGLVEPGPGGRGWRVVPLVRNEDQVEVADLPA